VVEVNQMNVGFLGFGEAASSITKARVGEVISSAGGLFAGVAVILEHSYGEMNSSDLAKYLLVRHVMHAERRAHELDEAADTISEGGLEPFATRGGAMRLAWSAGHGVSSKIAQLPESYTEVLDMFLDD
jgi:hypothetical protein